MTRAETLITLKILRTAFPAFYAKASRDELNTTVELWVEMFKNEDVGQVKQALYNVIESSPDYPPNIGRIKLEIREANAIREGKPTITQLWKMLKKALSNANYNAREEFEKLPDVLKEFLDTPQTLRELSRIDTAQLDTVYYSHFIKQIGELQSRTERERAMLAKGELTAESRQQDKALKESDIPLIESAS